MPLRFVIWMLRSVPTDGYLSVTAVVGIAVVQL